MQIPSCAKSAEQRSALGALLRNLIQAGLDQKGAIEVWWDECERIHRNEWSEADSPGEGLVPMQVPFSQPRQDMLTAQVCSVLTRQEPYMLAEDSTDSVTEELKERVLHKFWRSAGFEQKLRRASLITTDTNRVWFRIAWERLRQRPFSGLIWDVIHPRHVVLYPATIEGILGARLVGHRFYRRLREIEAMQAAGTYFHDEGAPVTGGDTPQEYDKGGEIAASGANPAVMGPDPKDQRIELWDVCFRYAGDRRLGANDAERWYRATLAFKTMTLLSMEPYPYSRPWYFDSCYVVSNDDAYWSGVSVARHLSGLQDAANKYNAALYNGSMMSAFPPIFGPELPEKDFRYGYGDYVPTDSPAQNWSPSVSFRGEPIMRHLEMLDMAGDRAARISSNTQGSMQVRSTTATETSIIAADVSVGMEEYIANFGASLGVVAEFTCELLCAHFSDWAAEAALLGVTREKLLMPCLWEPNGKTPGNTPGAKLAAAERLAGLAGQFGPATGIDIYELTRVIIANSGLFGADNIQVPKDKLGAPAPNGAGTLGSGQTTGGPAAPAGVPGLGNGAPLSAGPLAGGPGAVPPAQPGVQPGGAG
jgi:hypothetical protein